MNLITIIQDALTALNSDAEIFLLEENRADNKELEHTKDTIIIYPDWRTNNSFTQGLEIIKTREYNIIFKTPDEWDNSDNNIDKSYNDSTTLERINNMEVLCDSVFTWICANKDEYQEIQKLPTWNSPRPIVRENNGTMSGIEVKFNISFSGTVKCDFEL